jgi:hypothetical protein
MLKDKFIHDTLGIPLQTLQKWKKSEGHNFLLYQYLAHQDKEKFQSDIQKIMDFYDYERMTPAEFSRIIELNWEKFPQFKGYVPKETLDADIDSDKLVLTFALSEAENGKADLMVIRYAYTLSRRKEIGLKEIKRIINAVSHHQINPDTFKIVYVTTSGTPPAYFSEAACKVSLLTYAELYRTLSDKKLLIV